MINISTHTWWSDQPFLKRIKNFCWPPKYNEQVAEQYISHQATTVTWSRGVWLQNHITHLHSRWHSATVHRWNRIEKFSWDYNFLKKYKIGNNISYRRSSSLAQWGTGEASCNIIIVTNHFQEFQRCFGLQPNVKMLKYILNHMKNTVC